MKDRVQIAAFGTFHETNVYLLKRWFEGVTAEGISGVAAETMGNSSNFSAENLS